MSTDQPRRDQPRRAHVLVALVVVGLLGGTAAAFALTEQLKLERSPVYRTRVGKLLGPNCRCGLARIPIRFLLRKRETLTVVIVDSHERVVRNLLTRTPRPRGVQTFSWDGRDDSGRVVPAGVYKPRIHLARDRRTILMPNPIRVDTAAPTVSVGSVRPRVFSPDGDGRSDVVRIRVRMSEAARALLFVDGKLGPRLRRYGTAGVLRWFGSGLPAGRYRLVVRAVDLAGNLSQPVRAGSRAHPVRLGASARAPRVGRRAGRVQDPDAGATRSLAPRPRRRRLGARAARGSRAAARPLRPGRDRERPLRRGPS